MLRLISYLHQADLKWHDVMLSRTRGTREMSQTTKYVARARVLGSPRRQMRPSIVNISLLAAGCQEVVLAWAWTLDWHYDDYVT